jgi:hypothetical protein
MLWLRSVIEVRVRTESSAAGVTKFAPVSLA